MAMLGPSMERLLEVAEVAVLQAGAAASACRRSY